MMQAGNLNGSTVSLRKALLRAGSMRRSDDQSLSLLTKATADSDTYSDSEADGSSESEYTHDDSSGSEYTGNGNAEIAVEGTPTPTNKSTSAPVQCNTIQGKKGPPTPPSRRLPVRIASTDSIDIRPHLVTTEPETLIEWVAHLMEQYLQRIVAHRMLTESDNAGAAEATLDESQYTFSRSGSRRTPDGARPVSQRACIIDQVVEVIDFPKFAGENSMVLEEDAHLFVNLSAQVKNQLVTFVREISRLYHGENPFHNFEHACNVTFAVSKFLMRMVNECGPSANRGKDRTYGIATDPLTQFACILAALLHDADHEGVPNAQLEKDRPTKAQAYHGRAIAEQHSVVTAWTLFMQPQFSELRRTVYTTQDELHRLYQLVINIVLATDICDKQLKEFRTARFNQAFADNMDESVSGPFHHDGNLKATVGMEYLIQVSDVAHTMQPWNIYREWNAKLFNEMYKAYKEGRAAKDPSEFWFKGEIGFFDFVIIPLARQLQRCEIFGSLADECLEFAQNNRERWVREGHAAVQEMVVSQLDDAALLELIDNIMMECDKLM